MVTRATGSPASGRPKRRAARGLLRRGSAAAALLLAGPAAADVVLDGSIGPEPAGPIAPTGTTWLITDHYGAYQGTNLFYSLSQLDVPASWTASFRPQAGTNPPTSNVVVRVTGGESSVDGRVESRFAGADLYLLNPLGFVFGPSSSLASLGSVYVSSAPELRFPGGVTLQTGSSGVPVLTSDPPSAFGFLGGTPAADVSIQATSTRYRNSVGKGKTFTVVAGDVALTGGGILGSTGADVALVGVGSAAASVSASDPASFVARGSPAAASLGEVTVGDGTTVQSLSDSATGAGQVVIRGGRLVVEGGAELRVSAGSDVASKPRAIDLEASREIAISGDPNLGTNNTILTSQAAASASGGEMRLSAPAIEASGGATILSSQRGSGGAPAILIDGDDVSAIGAALIASEARSDAAGGTISIHASDTFGVSGGAAVLSSAQPQDPADPASGSGPGGDIHISAGAVQVDGGQILSDAPGAGAGGDIAVAADGEVDVVGQGLIASQTTGSARGGDVDVGAGERIFVETPADFAGDTSQISAITDSADPSAVGGDVTLRAPLVELSQGGQARTSTFGAADAGSLSVLDATTLSIHGTTQALGSGDATPAGLFARAEDGAAGTASGGDLLVQAESVEVTDGGEMSTRTFGLGAAGNLRIEAGQVTVRGGSELPSTISARGKDGHGGDLDIIADVLELASGGVVSATTTGSADAGVLSVQANVVDISGSNPGSPSGLFAQTRGGGIGAGNGGRITLDVGERISLSDGAQIATASSQGDGFAGDIEITGAPLVQVTSGALISASVVDTQAPQPGDEASVIVSGVGRLEVDGATIAASTSGNGPGGNIDITALESVDIEHGSLISARSERDFLAGDAGRIHIDGGKRLIVRDSAIETFALAAGGGQVALTADDVVYFENSSVNTFVTAGGGNGGNIDIPFPEEPAAPALTVAADLPPQASPRFVVLNDSSLIATADEGGGGNITVSAQNFLVSADSVIDASSRAGIDGLVQTTTPDAQLAGQITPLPANYFDASRMMKTPCAARTARTGSFVVQTREAPEPPPDAPLSAGAESEPGAAASPDGHCPS